MLTQAGLRSQTLHTSLSMDVISVLGSVLYQIFAAEGDPRACDLFSALMAMLRGYTLTCDGDFVSVLQEGSGFSAIQIDGLRSPP